jgi:hypothetical protein
VKLFQFDIAFYDTHGFKQAIAVPERTIVGRYYSFAFPEKLTIMNKITTGHAGKLRREY